MSARQRKNENFYTQRSKVNRSKASDRSKVPSKKANRYKADKASRPLATTYSRDRSNPYRDLRSESVPKRRERLRNYKYYNFSVVKAGQLNIQHSQTETHPEVTTQWHNPYPLEAFELPTISITRKSLYGEAQRTAPRRRHQRCCWKHEREDIKNAKRHELEAKKVALDLNTKGEYWDFGGLDPQRLHDYLWGDLAEESGDDVGMDAITYGSERSLSPCRCDECVWARYGYVPFSDEECGEEGYGAYGTMKAEPESESDDWTGWFTDEALFDQGSQLVDAPLEKRDGLDQTGITDLGWVDACGDEEPENRASNFAGWLEVWDPDWLDLPAHPKAESEHSFEMI